jgi:hypothetical protein
LSYSCVFSDSLNKVHTAGAPILEVDNKKELVDDDAVASTSREQHMAIKREESIDIKHEHIASDDEDDCLDLVSFHN